MTAGYLIGLLFGFVAGVTIITIGRFRWPASVGIAISVCFVFGCLGQVAFR